MCWLSYIIKWKFRPYIHHWQPLAPIVEHYSKHRVLLQRYVLALHCGEAKARYNTLQAFSKLYLSEAWLPKVCTMIYDVLYREKGGVTLDIPLCDSSTTLKTLQLTHECLHSTIDTFSFTLQHVYNKICTCTHVRQKWAWVSHTRHH